MNRLSKTLAMIALGSLDARPHKRRDRIPISQAWGDPDRIHQKCVSRSLANRQNRSVTRRVRARDKADASATEHGGSLATTGAHNPGSEARILGPPFDRRSIRPGATRPNRVRLPNTPIQTAVSLNARLHEATNVNRRGTEQKPDYANAIAVNHAERSFNRRPRSVLAGRRQSEFYKAKSCSKSPKSSASTSTATAAGSTASPAAGQSTSPVPALACCGRHSTGRSWWSRCAASVGIMQRRVRVQRSEYVSVFHGGIMLVLSRQPKESIVIGDNIVVTVVDIRGDKVRLGIQAPTEISMHRQEVYDAIQRERQSTEPKAGMEGE